MPVSSQHKVYIPNSSRDNQYLLAEFPLTDAILARFGAPLTDQAEPFKDFYLQLSKIFFELSDQAGLRNVHLIANGKTPVVRFHTEAYTLQTAEQILFFYNPAYHEAQNCFFEPEVKARKISLLFLATDANIRAHAADFHNKVRDLLQRFTAEVNSSELKIKVRDHQHLTYDLFAKQKGVKDSYGYKLRSLDARYKARGCELPAEHSALTYAIINLPLSRYVKEQVITDPKSDRPFTALYQFIQDQFVSATDAEKLTHKALLANGLLPLVRNSKFDKMNSGKELQMIGFDSNDTAGQLIADWDDANLVESVQLIIFATKEDFTDMGYGKFMNQVEAAMRRFAKGVNLKTERDDLVIRFHQHISYHL